MRRAYRRERSRSAGSGGEVGEEMRRWTSSLIRSMVSAWSAAMAGGGGGGGWGEEEGTTVEVLFGGFSDFAARASRCFSVIVRFFLKTYKYVYKPIHLGLFFFI